MKGRIAITAVLLGLSGGLQAEAGSNEPFIAVQGEAKREVVPDIFPLELTLKDTSTDAVATQAKVEGLAKNVLALAERLKIGSEDVEVSNLEISPEYKWDDEAEKQVFLGNTYERTIKIRFHSLPMLNNFITSLPKSDVLRIQTKQFETSREVELRRELLDGAIADARRTAEAMASGVGRRLGAAQNISNTGLNLTYSRSLDSVMVTGTRIKGLTGSQPPEAPPVVLREGRITLRQDVYIVYALD
ncbi:MAG: SIMPL domain-containing protein [Pseudoxanthomonas sp.]